MIKFKKLGLHAQCAFIVATPLALAYIVWRLAFALVEVTAEHWFEKLYQSKLEDLNVKD